jgi:hypothetical protein
VYKVPTGTEAIVRIPSPYELNWILKQSSIHSNPMLGETFEDRRTKFIAEKCSHHPPVLACHAEGEEWQYWATIEAKNSFTGIYRLSFASRASVIILIS